MNFQLIFAIYLEQSTFSTFFIIYYYNSDYKRSYNINNVATYFKFKKNAFQFLFFYQLMNILRYEKNLFNTMRSRFSVYLFLFFLITNNMYTN